MRLFDAKISTVTDELEPSFENEQESPPLIHKKGYYDEKTTRRKLTDYKLPAGVQPATDERALQNQESSFITFSQ